MLMISNCLRTVMTLSTLSSQLWDTSSSVRYLQERKLFLDIISNV